jgi:hypothetical protein
MVGIRSPDGLVVGLAPAALEFWVRFPNERNQGNRAPPSSGKNMRKIHTIFGMK